MDMVSSNVVSRRILLTVHCEIWPNHARGECTDTGLSNAIRGAETAEDDSCNASHGTEEGLANSSKLCRSECMCDILHRLGYALR